MKHLLPIVALSFFAPFCLADGPADNNAATVRPIPPIGTALSEEQAQQLSDRCREVRLDWAERLADAELQSKKGNKWQQAKQQQTLAALKTLK